jgi:hypothetical protein
MAGPPYYILISQSDLSSSSQPQIPLSSSLSHPIIQYHYLDDSPLALFPRTPDEQVLLLDYDPNAPPDIHPTVRSVSYNVAVTGTKAPDAPGATAEGVAKNFSEKMYILETITPPDDKSVVLAGTHSIFLKILMQSVVGLPQWTLPSQISETLRLPWPGSSSGLFSQPLTFDWILSELRPNAEMRFYAVSFSTQMQLASLPSPLHPDQTAHHYLT